MHTLSTQLDDFVYPRVHLYSKGFCIQFNLVCLIFCAINTIKLESSCVVILHTSYAEIQLDAEKPPFLSEEEDESGLFNIHTKRDVER